MVNVEARLKVKGKHFEISVVFDEAMKVKDGKGDIIAALNSNAVYHDLKKATTVTNKDLVEAFGTADFYTVAAQIIKKGEIQKPQEFRDAQRELKVKQVVNLIIKNASDQHGRPYTEERIMKAIDQVHFNFDNRAPEQQMHDLLPKLQEIIPIKIETKKIKLRIPARFSGQVYGILKDYKENEEWLSNGDLQVVVNIPAGLQIDFFDKLNGITHGAVFSEEMK